MTVIVNGEQRSLRDGITVTRLIEELGLGRRRIAIELNRAILPREEYDLTILHERDVMEIIHFVGGG